MPTYNPMEKQKFESKYWTAAGAFATENLSGDDSRVIMDRAVRFVRDASASNQPFFAVIWFHTPHSPVVAGNDDCRLYEQHDENHQHYFGCITAMDRQIGRLRTVLNENSVEDSTMIWFCSDNGPARQRSPRHVGSPGPFRGFKTSLYEGGIRVPGLLVWPERLGTHREVNVPAVTSDYFPTIVSALGIEMDENEKRPLDGIDLMPAIRGKTTRRESPIGFKAGKQLAWITDRYKLISRDNGETLELYDLANDQSEATDLAQQQPEILKQLKEDWDAWFDSVSRSQHNMDY